jgi:hypothetical protein
MKFTIAGINFKTKELAKKYYKERLNAFSALNTIGDLPLETTYALMELIKLHHDYERKMNNFLKFKIIKQKEWNTECFAIESQDGTIEAFSINECFQRTTEYGTVIKEARKLIQPQIHEFKKGRWLECTICQENHLPQVDHVIQFIDLWKCPWTDFAAYHKAYAILQILCYDCHQRKTLGVKTFSM